MSTVEQLTTPQAAKRFGVPERTWQAAIQRGELSATRLDIRGGAYLVTADDAERFARDWRKRRAAKTTPRSSTRAKRRYDRDALVNQDGPNAGQPWSDEDDVQVMRSDLFLREVAFKLGRSLVEVRARREFLRRHRAPDSEAPSSATSAAVLHNLRLAAASYRQAKADYEKADQEFRSEVKAALGDMICPDVVGDLMGLSTWRVHQIRRGQRQ